MLRIPAVFLSMFMACSLVQAPPVQVIAKGLVNPRGIAFAPNGQLFVTEAGRGGNGKCTVLGDGQNACYGETGALTRIDPAGTRAPVHVVTGLPSLAAADGLAPPGRMRCHSAAAARPTW
jgi:glucose/arabinose dehydrogenase